MESLLILGGLLLMLTGLVWLIILAFGTSLLWGFGSLILPITLAFVVRHWRVARKAIMLSALGIIPLIVGLALLASKDTERMEKILSLSWLEPQIQTGPALDINLRGELHGAAFNPQQAELLDGVLSLREGQDFFAQREIRIRLPQHVNGPLTIDVLPEDRGQLPEVELSWLLPGQDLPEARRLSGGYTLHLNLQPAAEGVLQGDFHLVLPPHYATALSGKVEVVRSGLRYSNGRIDYKFDSRDTIAQVITEYLNHQLEASAVVLEPLPAYNLAAKTLALQVRARVEGVPQRWAVQLHKNAELGWQVTSAKRLISAGDVVRTAEQEKPSAPFSLLSLMSDPQQYMGQHLKVELASGGSAEGVFNGLVHDGLIQLRRNLRAADGAVFVFHPDDIAHIRLLEP